MSNINLPQGESSTSKVDLLTGKHTRDIIVFFLIIALLLAITLNSGNEGINDRLLDALLALIGFFAGSKLTKE